jgi:hypothetical protein
MELPEDRLEAGGWSLVEETSETLFRLPTARVEGDTRIYEDRGLRERVEAATGFDRMWRFFFATDVHFEPPLAPGIGPAMILPTVISEARREFAGDLRERGFTNVERTRTERIRTRSGERVRLQGFGAKLPTRGELEGVDAITVTGWLGVWTVGGEFRVAGGAYPDRLEEVADALGVSDLGPSARDCRDELLRLVRDVR